MARWHSEDRPRLEAPAWYRRFDLAAWDEPDGHEAAMIEGCTGGDRPCWPGAPDSRWPQWPQFLHEQHARRRWHEARYAYGQANPEFAEQEFEDLRSSAPTRLSSG